MSEQQIERSLADKDLEVAEQREPLTTDEFLAGVRTRRKAVKVRPNLHVMADMERLVEQIEGAGPDEDVDDLIDEYESARDTFTVEEWWVVEQRSPERRARVRREAAKARGWRLDEDLQPVMKGQAFDDAVFALGIEAALDHIVSPEGVTYEGLAAMYEASPGEVMRIMNAMAVVNTIPSEADEREVLRDFSSRRSAARADS